MSFLRPLALIPHLSFGLASSPACLVSSCACSMSMSEQNLCQTDSSASLSSFTNDIIILSPSFIPSASTENQRIVHSPIRGTHSSSSAFWFYCYCLRSGLITSNLCSFKSPTSNISLYTSVQTMVATHSPNGVPNCSSSCSKISPEPARLSRNSHAGIHSPLLCILCCFLLASYQSGRTFLDIVCFVAPVFAYDPLM